MKALKKDCTRRYNTANGFAADVARYLNGEQVQAVPPSSPLRNATGRTHVSVCMQNWPIQLPIQKRKI